MIAVPLFLSEILMMKSFGLTGGIATGKSTVAKIMEAADSDLVLFDADNCVKRLYQTPYLIGKLVGMFGEDVLGDDGGIDRSMMREVIFSDEQRRVELQEFIHPLVRKECLAMQAEAEHSGNASLFVADVPLLFEGGFDFGQEANLVVVVSQKTQIQRLKMRSGFDDATVLAILAAQLPIAHKFICADIVLWNEGPLNVLEAQINRFIKHTKFTI